MSAQPQLREAFDSDQFAQNPVRMKVKQRQDDDDRGTIMVLSNDPFQSLAIPPSGERRASARTMNVTPPQTLNFRWNRLSPAAEATTAAARPAEVVSQPPPTFRLPTAAPTRAAAPEAAPSVSIKVQTQKSSARDAWCAVVLMGMFIAGGIAWTNNRLADDASTISGLRTQLADANDALNKKIDQLKQLYARVTDAESETAKAKAALAQSKQR